MRQISKRRSKYGSVIAEFGPAFFIFVILVLIPCVNLIFYAAAIVSIQHIVEEASRAAAIASTQTEALTNVGNKAVQWLNGSGGAGPGLGAFAHLNPKNPNGINDVNKKRTGCSVEILITDSSGPRPPIQLHGKTPRKPLPFDDPKSATTNLSTVQYEYQVTGIFTVEPFLNMAGIPGVGMIPAVGAPTTVSYSSKAQVENVPGLDD